MVVHPSRSRRVSTSATFARGNELDAWSERRALIREWSDREPPRCLLNLWPRDGRTLSCLSHRLAVWMLRRLWSAGPEPSLDFAGVNDRQSVFLNRGPARSAMLRGPARSRRRRLGTALEIDVRRPCDQSASHRLRVRRSTAHATWRRNLHRGHGQRRSASRRAIEPGPRADALSKHMRTRGQRSAARSPRSASSRCPAMSRRRPRAASSRAEKPASRSPAR